MRKHAARHAVRSVLLLGLLLGLSACGPGDDFVGDGARAFEGSVAGYNGAAGTLFAAVEGGEDAAIIGEGALKAGGRFTFSFDAAVSDELIALQVPLCPELEAGLIIVAGLNLLEGAELLGDLVQASTAAHARGGGDGTRLLHVYSDRALTSEGGCRRRESDISYDLELEQGWNNVVLRTRGTALSYSSGGSNLTWYFVALD